MAEMRRGGAVHDGPMVGGLILEGGTAVTMVKGQAPIQGARIVVRDGRIEDIGSVVGPPPHEGRLELIDASRCIVLPGLINAHSHAAMSLFRGYADDLPLREWLFDRIFPAEAAYLNPESVYWGSMLACLEMIASGTTCFADGYFFQDETIRAVHAAGLRALIAQGVLDFPAPGMPDPRRHLQTVREFLERWTGFSDLIRPGIFCHSPLTCSGDTLSRSLDLSKEYGAPLQIHLSETRQEVDDIMARFGMRPVHYLDRLGLLDPSLIAAHGVHLDRGEIERLAETGVRVVHVPESNMKLASGVAPVSAMLRAGIPVGLGTDGCASNNDLDLFREMDIAAKSAKVFDQNPVSLSALTTLGLATAGGAAVIGLEREIGTLERGKTADIVVVDLNAPHLCPAYDPVSLLVYAANGGDVRDVIVNGRVLMRNRQFLTIDADEVMGRVREIGNRIKGLRNTG